MLPLLPDTTSYVASVSDTSASGSSVSAVLVAAAALSQASAPGDSLSVFATFLAGVSENTSAITEESLTQSVNIADSAISASSVTATAVFVVTALGSATSSDAPSVTAQLFATLASNAKSSDKFLNVIAVTISENAIVADTITGIGLVAASIADAVVASGSASGVSHLLSSIAASAQSHDIETAGKITLAAVGDSAVSNALAGAAANFSAHLANPATAADGLSVLAAFVAQCVEAHLAQEQIVGALNALASVSEGIVSEDIWAAFVGLPVEAAQTLLTLLGLAVTSQTAIINGSECYVSWACRDINGNPYTPTSLEYSVWDVTNDVEVAGPISISPAVASGTVTLTANVNTMNPASAAMEQRQVTLRVGIPGGSVRNDVATYNILRKDGTP